MKALTCLLDQQHTVLVSHGTLLKFHHLCVPLGFLDKEVTLP